MYEGHQAVSYTVHIPRNLQVRRVVNFPLESHKLSFLFMDDILSFWFDGTIYNELLFDKIKQFSKSSLLHQYVLIVNIKHKLIFNIIFYMVVGNGNNPINLTENKF